MPRLKRLIAMAIKELQVVLLDRRSRLTLLGSPILQLALFGLATTLDVTNVDLGVVNRDAGMASEHVLADFAGSRNIRRLIAYPSDASLLDAIEKRKVIAGVVLPSNLSQEVAAGRTGEIGILLDGRRINSAQIVAGYVGEIVTRAGMELRPQGVRPGPQISAVNRFNPNLRYPWFTMPALIALITTVVSLSVSMQSIAREREMGTMDELLILPLTRFEILIGKLAPGFVVAFFNVVAFVILIPLLYGVPLKGSIVMLLGATFCFGLSISGIGLSVSTVTQNQQQAFLAGFLFIVPMIMVSGYVTPYDNMPGWLQIAAKFDPLYHMLIICQGSFLKEIPLYSVFQHTWPMLAVACITLGIATLLFRLRIE